MSKLTIHNVVPITRLHLTVRADAQLNLPPYAGSMLRGAWGHGLLALAHLPHPGGQPCSLRASCPYCLMFATLPPSAHSLQKFSAMPQPYVIEPPQGGAQRLTAGQTFRFGLVLMGKAHDHLPALLHAWELALRGGLGVQQTPCTLLDVQSEIGLRRFIDKHEQLSKQEQTIPSAQPLGDHATLLFYSPLRLQVQGKPAKAGQLTARNLLITLARRWQLLQDVHLGQEAPQQNFAQIATQAEGIALDAQALRWFDWGRYSQRQQQEMQFGGLLGNVQLKGDLAPFAQLLHLGQWLHMGKNTSFGLGGYQLSATRALSDCAN